MSSINENAALNTYLLSVALLEQLDKLQHSNKYKQQLKRHGNGMVKEIERFDKEVFNQNDDKDAMNAVVEQKVEQINKILF